MGPFLLPSLIRPTAHSTTAIFDSMQGTRLELDRIPEDCMMSVFHYLGVSLLPLVLNPFPLNHT